MLLTLIKQKVENQTEKKGKKNQDFRSDEEYYRR